MPRYIKNGLIMDVDKLHENLFINKGWKLYVDEVEQVSDAVNDESEVTSLDSNTTETIPEPTTEPIPTKRDISRMNKSTLIEFAKTHELTLTATTREAIIDEILKQLNLN